MTVAKEFLASSDASKDVNRETKDSVFTKPGLFAKISVIADFAKS